MTGNPVVRNDEPRPYVGLRAFRTDEQNIFYGRRRESVEIGRAWRANKLTLLYGTSGVGKTSLLQAGIIPSLDGRRFNVMPVGRLKPGMISAVSPVGANPYTVALLSSWAPDRKPGTLGDTTISGFLRDRTGQTDQYGDLKPVLVAIDQFEELFSAPPQWQPHVQAFMDELAEALEEQHELRLLISLREDYLASFLPYENLIAGQSHTRSRLLPLGPQAALEAIRGPLRGTSRSFDPGAAEQLVDGLRTVNYIDARGEESIATADSVEPVQVQVVCSALWESLPPGTTVITSAHVREHADVDRFLANFCSRALNVVAREHGIAAARIRSWLQQTFITEFGTRGTAYKGITETAGMPNGVVEALEDQHVVRAELRAGTRWYELQHDRLIEPIRQVDPQEHLEAARLARDSAAWDEAERHATQAIRMVGADDLLVWAEAENLLGEVAEARHEPDGALARYRAAASLFEVLQDSARVGQLLAASGRLCLSWGRYSAALNELRTAIARIPTDLDVKTDLARALWHSGQPWAAVGELNGVLNVDPNLVMALTTRGEILADLGESEPALRDLNRVRHHQRASTLAARALALAQLDRFEAAEQEMDDALANGEGDGPVLLRAALVHMLMGRRAEVVRLTAESLQAQDPALPPHLRESAVKLLAEHGSPD